MTKTRFTLTLLIIALAAFLARRWSGFTTPVRADAAGPQIDIRDIGGGSSLVVYYPDMKKLFVYQPFAGPPTWPCAYSIQLGSPGGKVERQQCEDSQ
jgi:hypothetical protein